LLDKAKLDKQITQLQKERVLFFRDIDKSKHDLKILSEKKEAAEKWVYCAPGKKALQDSVDFRQETRYLLFDDDQEKNFHDLLCLLDRIAAVERGEDRQDNCGPQGKHFEAI
jgi:hypothetical protein